MVLASALDAEDAFRKSISCWNITSFLAKITWLMTSCNPGYCKCPAKILDRDENRDAQGNQRAY